LNPAEPAQEPTLTESEPTAPTEPAPKADGGSIPIGPIVVVSTGAAVSIAGIVMMVVGNGMASSLQDEVDAAAKNRQPIDLKYVESEESAAEGPLIGGQVMLGIGLAAIAAGTVWWVMDAGEDSSAAGVRVLPLAGGLALDGRF